MRATISSRIPSTTFTLFTPFDKMTIADLLNMDGGLPELFGNAPLDPQIAQAVGGQLPLTRDDVIHYLAKQPGIVPGVPANAAYSNTRLRAARLHRGESPRQGIR